MEDAPYDSILSDEISYFTYCFCALCSMALNRKLNFQNVLILMLKDENLMSIFQEMINEPNKKEAVRLFLSVSPSSISEKTVLKNLFDQNFS